MSNQLSADDFLKLIKLGPLVSIDLLVTDHSGRLLVGKRSSEPASGYFFVPGGRVYKGENLSMAFARITENELGRQFELSTARLVGAYTHIYDENFFGKENISTHYVVLAYEVSLDLALSELPTNQHSEYRWLKSENALDIDSGMIHENIVPYLAAIKEFSSDSYLVMNQRRDNFNTLLWQTPVVSLTAQAFLFSIILNTDLEVAARGLAAGLAVLCSVASYQLIIKHRWGEELHARMAEDYERKHGLTLVNLYKKSDDWVTGISSVLIWRMVFLLFATTAILSVIYL